jgi:hypothetical protein
MLFVGDDWAEDHHDIEIVNEEGRRLVRRRLPEGLDGVTRLHALIASVMPEQWADLPAGEATARVKVGIETERGPWVTSLVGLSAPSAGRQAPGPTTALCGLETSVTTPLSASSATASSVSSTGVSRPAAATTKPRPGPTTSRPSLDNLNPGMSAAARASRHHLCR